MTESQIILYTTPDGDIKVDTVLQNETIWLTQLGDGGAFWCQCSRYIQAPVQHL
jgi:hypothetical protein